MVFSLVGLILLVLLALLLLVLVVGRLVAHVSRSLFVLVAARQLVLVL